MDISEQYELQYNVEFVDRLGEGKDGRVFKTSRDSAVKFFDDALLYVRELRAYQILSDQNIDQVNGFNVPCLLRSDDDLLAIEMTVVKPPFVLDFASAYTHQEYNRFDFPQEVLEDREAHWREIFGDRWPIVESLCDVFTAKTGLMLLDLSLNNIKFAEP